MPSWVAVAWSIACKISVRIESPVMGKSKCIIVLHYSNKQVWRKFFYIQVEHSMDLPSCLFVPRVKPLVSLLAGLISALTLLVWSLL